MKSIWLVFALLSISVTQLSRQSGWIAGSISNGSSRSYRLVLSVRLQDPFNRAFEIRNPVSLGKRFHATAQNGTVTDDISGIVRASTVGKYALNLTVLEWQSAKSNMRDTTNFQLELDKPQSAGPI